MILKAEGVNKNFGTNSVLRNINFDLSCSEVHGIIGSNGAGKSTLIKIFSGVYKPDSGSIYLNNKLITGISPHLSIKSGISVLYQELDLIPELSVAENITLGLEKKIFGFFKSGKFESEKAKETLTILKAEHILPERIVKNLSIADQQITAIAKALALNAKIIILDEPTAALSFREIENLFKVIKKLKSNGVSFIYISHRINELKDICDRISILKDGEIAYTEIVSNIDNEVIINKLSSVNECSVFKKQLENDKGKDYVTQASLLEDDKEQEVLMEVCNLSLRNKLKNVSFQLHKGEVLGIAGFAGSGRTEILETIYGITRPESGKIMIEKQEIEIRKPADAIKHKICMVPESRKDSALYLQADFCENATFNSVRKYLRAKFFTKSKQQLKIASERINKLSIKTNLPKQNISELSGGNQQKTVLGNCFFENSKIILMDEPTRGIDLESKKEIYEIIKEWQNSGTSFIIVSSEFEELIRLCDRILILNNGTTIKELVNNNISEQNIIKTILGHNFNEIHI